MKIDYGVFCEVYGKNYNNLVLEYVLEMGELDFAISDMFELGISKPKLYQIVKELIKENILEKSRVVAGTQLFKLADNPKTKLLKKSFKECLNLVMDEHTVEVKN